MRRTGYSLALILAAIIVAWMIIKVNAKEANNTNPTPIKTVTMPLYQSYNKVVEITQSELNKQQQKEIEQPKRPAIKNIPIPEDILDYLWECSNKSGLAYEMLLSIAKTESDFDHKFRSSTADVGLYQIHKGTDRWIAEELKVKKYDLTDYKTNINFAIFYLTYLRDYWVSQGASDEETFDLTVISFNRGIEGTKRYLQHHSFDDNTYLKTVKKNKYEMEQDEREVE